ncbi:MAG: hypothetical protein RIQ68_474 [Pseudomonadota bacterium]|jgi:hypothetical protein
MKWIVAGAGVLLSMAGLYGLVTGASIIQVERGWASFIAGAVALSAGVITLALAALMGRLEQLVVAWTGASFARADAQQSREEEPEPFRPMAPIFAPVVTEKSETVAERDAPMFPDLPPLRVETQNVVEPVVEVAPEPVAPEPVIEARKEERTSPLRDFKFVFPPIDDDKQDEKIAAPVVEAPALEPEDKVEPLKPLDAKPAARFNLGWLRRNRDESAEPVLPERMEPEPFIEPAPAPQAEPVMEAPVEPEPIETQIEVESVAIEVEMPVEETPFVEPVAEPVEEPAPAPAPAPDPFSPDWLERALSGADEVTVAPAPRFVPPSQRRAAQADIVEPAPAPAPVVEAPVVADSAEAPVEIGRYSANDVSYIMFSDGSITAETASGTYRFNSLIELKDFIERGA